MINRALELGAIVKACDPIALHSMKAIFPDIEHASSWHEAVDDADVVSILTEWDEFRSIALARLKALLKEPVVFDGRNILKVHKLEELGYGYG